MPQVRAKSYKEMIKLVEKPVSHHLRKILRLAAGLPSTDYYPINDIYVIGGKYLLGAKYCEPLESNNESTTM